MIRESLCPRDGHPFGEEDLVGRQPHHEASLKDMGLMLLWCLCISCFAFIPFQ